eukprot:280574-Chlamydomonas_euryale.AAC.1
MPSNALSPSSAACSAMSDDARSENPARTSGQRGSPMCRIQSATPSKGIVAICIVLVSSVVYTRPRVTASLRRWSACVRRRGKGMWQCALSHSPPASPSIQPVSRPSSQPVSRPPSQPVSRPPSQPASQICKKLAMDTSHRSHVTEITHDASRPPSFHSLTAQRSFSSHHASYSAATRRPRFNDSPQA